MLKKLEIKKETDDKSKLKIHKNTRNETEMQKNGKVKREGKKKEKNQNRKKKYCHYIFLRKRITAQIKKNNENR